MKKIIGFLVSLMLCFTLTSCVTTAAAQIDDVYDDGIDISLVITYGTPFYNTEGLILYYVYRDMFYYPCFYYDRYYLYRYHRPLPPNRLNRLRGYRPIPRDYYRHNPPPRGRVGDFREHSRRGNVTPNNPPRRVGTTTTRPQSPSVRPAQPQVRPTQPQVRSAQPSVRPTQPQVRPSQPSVRPTQPQVRPTQPSVRQVAPRTSNSNGNFGGARRR